MWIDSWGKWRYGGYGNYEYSVEEVIKRCNDDIMVYTEGIQGVIELIFISFSLSFIL